MENLSDKDKLSDKLKAQFKSANEYLKHRVKWIGDAAALQILEKKD
jgi:hypothetical protein